MSGMNKHEEQSREMKKAADARERSAADYKDRHSNQYPMTMSPYARSEDPAQAQASQAREDRKMMLEHERKQMTMQSMMKVMF